MATPVVIASIGLALAAVGTAVGVAGSMNAAKAQSDNARYQAQVAANDRTIAEQNAAYASKAGAAAVTRSQLRQREVTGQVGAALAANGLDIGSGSPSEVRATSAETGQLDTETTAQNAALQVYGYRSQGSNFGAQSGLYGAESSQAKAAAPIAGGATLLSGAGSLASKWSSWQLASGSGGGGYTAPAYGGVDPALTALNPSSGGVY